MRHQLHIRRFLNRAGHHAGAYIIARVPDSDSCRSKDCSHHFCDGVILDIADCSRVVHLDFDLDTAAGRRNSLHKINTLIDVLTRFRDALEIESTRIPARGS